MKIVVIGESCTDEYVYGTCDRVCPEAAALCFINEGKVSSNPGMAANVYENLKALNKDNKFQIDLISSKSSITKRRFVDKKYNTIVFREDINDKSDRINLSNLDLNQYDAIVFSDYNKGFLLEEDIITICSQYKNRASIFIDTKKKLKNIASHVHFVKINSLEYFNNKEDISFISDNTHLIVTSGESGATMYYKNNIKTYPTQKVILRDVCGAGDTFLAGLILKYCESQNIDSAIEFANNCASNVVSRFGVVTI